VGIGRFDWWGGLKGSFRASLWRVWGLEFGKGGDLWEGWGGEGYGSGMGEGRQIGVSSRSRLD